MRQQVRITRLASVTAVLFALTSPVHAQDVKGGSADSVAVANTMEHFLRAFNDLDWDAFRDNFADSATVFQPLPSSLLRNDGRAEFESVFENFFDAVRSDRNGPPYLNIQPRDVRIQMLGEVAVVTFHLRTDDRPSVGRRTFVLRKQEDGAWRIVHLHASNVHRPVDYERD